jgi:hypothetical protein
MEENNTMGNRKATHAEAVYIARALNLHIDTVWTIIEGMTYTTFADLEMAVHRAFLQHPESAPHTIQE